MQSYKFDSLYELEKNNGIQNQASLPLSHD
jgi:hypothetical protein